MKAKIAFISLFLGVSGCQSTDQATEALVDAGGTYAAQRALRSATAAL